MLPLSMTEQYEIAELLTLVLDTNEFLDNVSQINAETARLTEEMMNKLIFCTRATTVLFNAVQCVPKSTNIYGWLRSCLSLVIKIVRINRDHLRTNMICHVSILGYRDIILAQMAGI
jgi:hypothetical protein